MSQRKSIALNLLAVRDLEPTGIERFVQNVVGRLRLSDVQAFLFLRKGVAPGFALGPDFVQAHPQLSLACYRVGPTWLRIPLEMLWLSWVCRGTDVVFSVNNFGPLWGKRGQKRAVVIHDVWFMSDIYDGSRLSKYIFYWLLRIQISRSSRIFTVSEFSRREISRHFNLEEKNIHVVENCLPDFDPPDATTPGEQKDPYFLLVGSDRKNKNVWRALLAYREYASSALSPVGLVVVGSYSDRYKKTINGEFGELGPLLQFDGYVASERYVSLLATSEGVLFPSLYEGYGIPVMEAACSGKPVLVAKNTVCAELAGPLAVVVDGLDIQSITEGIRQLEEYDPEAAGDRAVKLRDHCKNCDLPVERLQNELLILADEDRKRA